MRTIWQALAWKEWHEHKWKLAAVAAILLSVTGVILWFSDPELFIVSIGLLIYGIIPIAIFMGASDAAGESTRGTLRFTQSLPVSMQRVAIWKFAMGLGACAVPILLSIVAVVSWYMYQARFNAEVVLFLEQTIEKLYHPVEGIHNILLWSFGSGTLSLTIMASLYVWTLALGVNRRTEVRAGATALAVIIALWLGFIVAGEFLVPRFRSEINQIAAVAASVMPGGFPLSLVVSLTGPHADHSNAYWALAAAAVFYPLLIASFAWRFGSSDAGEGRSKAAATSSVRHQQWLPQPFHSTLRAMLWKQWRESGPIVLLGVAAIFALFVGNLLLFSSWYSNDDPRRLNDLLVSLTMSIGFLTALIVGICNFDQDMSPRINEFWRSRPIRVDQWFWTKYMTGMLLLAVALYTPIIVASLIASSGANDRLASAFSERSIIMICFHLAIYATATATIIVIRQPVYAAILGVGALLVGIAIVWTIWGIEAIRIESIVYAVEFTTAILATFIAWIAIRFDWGNRGRY